MGAQTIYYQGVDTPLAAPLRGGELRGLFLGDSLAQEPLKRREADRWLRTAIHGVLWVGDKGLDAATGGIIGSTDLTSWAHSGVGGNTIAQVTARVAALAAELGEELAPHFIVDISVTNDISQLRTLAQIEGDKLALWAAIRAAWPGARVITCTPPTWRSGSASGVTWADKVALRNQVAAALPVWARRGGGLVVHCDAYADQPPQEISDDGVHPGQDGDGYRRAGRAIAAAILRLAGIELRRPREADGSLRLAPRRGSTAIQLVTPGIDRVTWAATPALAPESESFALTCWFIPTSSPASAASIIGVGPPGTFVDGVAVCQVGDGLSVYIDGAPAAIAGDGGGYSDGVLRVGEPHHLALVCDRAANRIGLAVNGQVVWHSRDLTAAGHPGASWVIPVAGAYFYFGKFVVDGAPGLLREVAFYKGAGAPTIWDLPEFAERTCADGILWTGLSALWRCDEGSGAPAEAAGVVGAGTVVGAGWAAWPGYEVAAPAGPQGPPGPPGPALTPSAVVHTAAASVSFGELLLVDPSGGGFPVTLPEISATDQGKICGVKNDSGSSNAVPISGDAGQTVDGGASVSITVGRQAYTFSAVWASGVGRWVIT